MDNDEVEHRMRFKMKQFNSHKSPYSCVFAGRTAILDILIVSLLKDEYPRLLSNEVDSHSCVSERQNLHDRPD